MVPATIVFRARQNSKVAKKILCRFMAKDLGALRKAASRTKLSAEMLVLVIMQCSGILDKMARFTIPTPAADRDV